MIVTTCQIIVAILFGICLGRAIKCRRNNIKSASSLSGTQKDDANTSAEIIKRWPIEVLPALPRDFVFIEMNHLPNLWFGCNKETMLIVKQAFNQDLSNATKKGEEHPTPQGRMIGNSDGYDTEGYQCF